jgi:hypothetical protein
MNPIDRSNSNRVQQDYTQKNSKVVDPSKEDQNQVVNHHDRSHQSGQVQSNQNSPGQDHSVHEHESSHQSSQAVHESSHQSSQVQTVNPQDRVHAAHHHGGEHKGEQAQAVQGIQTRQKSWRSHFAHMQNPLVNINQKFLEAETKRVSKEDKKVTRDDKKKSSDEKKKKSSDEKKEKK